MVDDEGSNELMRKVHATTRLQIQRHDFYFDKVYGRNRGAREPRLGKHTS